MTTLTPAVETPHRKIWQSSAGEAIKNNRILCGLSAGGAAVAVAGASAQNETFAKISEKGIVPLCGTALAGIGAAAVQDAMINDRAMHKTTAASKLTAGTIAVLAGTEIAGNAYKVPIAKEALTKTLNIIAKNGETLMGAGLIAGGLKTGQLALKHASLAVQEPDDRPLNTVKAVGAGTGGALAALAGTQMIGEQQNIPYAKQALTKTLQTLSDSQASLGIAGAALSGGALISADQAIKNAKRGGNEFVTAALASGAVGGGLGGAELLGRAANIEHAKNLFIDNAQWLQGLSLSAIGLAWLSNATKRIINDDITGPRGIEVSAGAATALGGLSYATENLSEGLSNNLASAMNIGVSGGLSLATVGFAKQMSDAFDNHKPEAAIFNGSLAALSAIGSLFMLSHVIESPVLDKIGEVLEENTLQPLLNHVITPAMEYLYHNPIAGGLMLVGGTATLLHLRGRHDQPSLYD